MIILKESIGKKRKSRFFLCEDEELKEYDYENKQTSGNLQRQQWLIQSIHFIIGYRKTIPFIQISSMCKERSRISRMAFVSMSAIVINYTAILVITLVSCSNSRTKTATITKCRTVIIATKDCIFTFFFLLITSWFHSKKVLQCEDKRLFVIFQFSY